MKFKISEEVFKILPTACFGVVVAKGIDNSHEYPQLTNMLNDAISEAELHFNGKKPKEDPAILPYRDAFRKLSINPNKFMSSIEALLTRVSKKKGLPHINPIVDMGNAISLKYFLPIGAHDIAQADSDIEVRFSRDGDTFIPFGEREIETIPAGELVYTVGTKVRTRRWIWRQSELGKITNASSDIMFPIDGFSDSNKAAILNAREEIASICKQVLNCKCVNIGFIDASSTEFEL